MGTINQKDSFEDKDSNSSVLSLSLETKSNIIIDNDSSSTISDIKKQLIYEVNLPIENEYFETNEISLEDKEEEIKMNLMKNEEIEEDILNISLKDENIQRKRSKSFAPNKACKNAPKIHPKITNEYISPLKLSLKNFGNFPNWNKRANSVLYEFQKNLIDCKSCNDDEEPDIDYYLLNSETERTTPNIEDLQNLSNCRKKMTIFRNNIDDRTIKEYENILNSDYLFIEYDNNNKKKLNNHHHQKKNNYWHKHIKNQQLKNRSKMLSSHLSRLSYDNSLKRSETVINENIKDNELFILGVLESAANERKGRNTYNV